MARNDSEKWVFRARLRRKGLQFIQTVSGSFLGRQNIDIQGKSGGHPRESANKQFTQVGILNVQDFCDKLNKV
jgi:hypothetical protein